MVENSLSTKYFSKEFPSNWEVEWKANLSTNYPLGFINSVRDCISKLGLGPYHETTSMGDMKNGLHFHHLLYHYYGHKEGERVIRDFVLVQPPETPILIPQIKQNVLDTGLDEKAKFILIREEKKGGLSQAFPQKKHHKYLESFSQKTGFDIHHIGTIERRRYSLYLSNKMSNRNYSLVADNNEILGFQKPLSFSQVEIEYKGISGIGSDSGFSRLAVLEELYELGNNLVSLNNGTVIPTLLTKLDFIIESQNK